MSFRRGYIPRDYQSHPLGSSEFTVKWDEQAMPLLSRKEAVELAKQNIAKGTDPLSLCFKWNVLPMWQNGLGYCWIYAAVMGLKVGFAHSGQPVPDLEPTAPGALIKGYRDRGGNAFQAFPHLAEHGVPTKEYWKQHALDRRYDTPEMRENARKHLVVQWFELPDNSDQHKWTALAYNFSIWSGYMNIGHAMLSARLEEDSRGNPVALDINSWSREASESTSWKDSWLGDKRVIYRRGGRDFRSFEQYAVRVVSTVS